MRAPWLLLLFGFSGCGGSAAPAATPESTPQSSAEGDECLKTAAVERQPPKDAPEVMELSHILVRHNELEPSEAAERTRAQACLIAKEARDTLLAGGDWNDVHAKYSDGGRATHGSLGKVNRWELEKTFANTAFALGESEVSHVVESPRGFHVIVRHE